MSETLRLEQSEYLLRIATEDLDFEGFTIPRGWVVRVCVQESHRDPEVFPHPDAFDPDRFQEGHPPPTEYAPFGMHDRSCVGEYLARTAARVFLCELVDGYDLDHVPGGAKELNPWRHWAPSPGFRVSLESSRRREQPHEATAAS